jgi:hypothetical protein
LGVLCVAKTRISPNSEEQQSQRAEQKEAAVEFLLEGRETQLRSWVLQIKESRREEGIRLYTSASIIRQRTNPPSQKA